MASNFTEDDLKAIEQAIASGALRVEYNDRTVIYRSIKELKEAREMIRRCLGKSKKGGRVLITNSKGTC